MIRMFTTIFLATSLAGCLTENSDSSRNLPSTDKEINLQSEAISSGEISQNRLLGTTDKSPQLENNIFHVESSNRSFIGKNKPSDESIVQSKRKITSRAYVDPYTPACTELNINVAYTLNLAVGGIYCIYFDISNVSRTEFIVLDQDANNQVRQQILQDINGDQNFTILDDSNTTATVESYVHMTEPGHYYMQLFVQNTNGGAIRFAAASNTSQVDNYEPNDEFLDSVGLSGNLDYDSYFGNIDHGTDIDYFSYTSEHGQDIEFQLQDPNNLFQLEVLGDGWQTFNTNQMWNIAPTSSGQIFHFRITPANPALINPSIDYEFHVGSTIDRITQTKAWSDENLIDPVGMYRKFHNELNWEAKILDTEGQPISGVNVEFEWGTKVLPYSSSFGVSGQNGFAKNTITTPDCIGEDEIDKRDMITNDMWHLKFNPGAVRYRVVDRPNLTVGHDINYPLDAYHMCDEDLLFTSQHMSGSGSCSDSIYYCPPAFDSSLEWKHRNHSQELPVLIP